MPLRSFIKNELRDRADRRQPPPWKDLKAKWAAASGEKMLSIARHAFQGCQYLLLALFKLFQFDGRHVEGMQVSRRVIFVLGPCWGWGGVRGRKHFSQV